MNRLLFDWAFLSKFSVWVYLYTTTDHTYRSSSPSPVLHQSLAFNDNNNSVLYNESTRQIAQFVFQHYQCRRWLQRAISRRIFWMTHLVILLTFDWSAPKNHQWMFTHFITASTVENSMLSTSCCRGHMSQLANIVRDREREREQKSQACLSSAKRIGKFVSVFFFPNLRRKSTYRNQIWPSQKSLRHSELSPATENIFRTTDFRGKSEHNWKWECCAARTTVESNSVF